MESDAILPMLSLPLKQAEGKIDFTFILGKYIRNYYGEDPNKFTKEIEYLNNLRSAAAWPNYGFSGCSALKRYYCQLQLIQKKFPQLQTSEDYKLRFSWRHAYNENICTTSDIIYEMNCILYNIGALHSQLGASNSNSIDDIKLSCTHFQCAAWAFENVLCNWLSNFSSDMSKELLNFFSNIMLAQAQECILWKSISDHRKHIIIAKVAAQLIEFYKEFKQNLNQISKSSIPDIIKSKTYKLWVHYVNMKMPYFEALSHYYQGLHSKEIIHMGERVSHLVFSSSRIQEAIKMAKSFDGNVDLMSSLTKVEQLIINQLNEAKRENDFVYHEKVPEIDQLINLKGASLVKSISFSCDDPDIAGEDVFSQLLPMEIHEASSLYSEDKDNIRRKFKSAIEEKNQKLSTVLESLHLEQLEMHIQGDVLPQALIDKCAQLSVDNSIIQNIVDAINELSGLYHDVDSLLREAHFLLQREEEKEAIFQKMFGKQPLSVVIADLAKEIARYQDAHQKAEESNCTLHKAATFHLDSIRLLTLPLDELQKHVPSILSITDSAGKEAFFEFQKLLIKVNEMKEQRIYLQNDLFNSLENDDITSKLVIHSDQSLSDLFKNEIKKHDYKIQVLEQNLVAQENIIHALIEINAKYGNMRKLVNDVVKSRETFFQTLLMSWDICEEIFEKEKDGIEFYKKLKGNIINLLEQLQKSCADQDEKRKKASNINMDCKEVKNIQVASSLSSSNFPNFNSVVSLHNSENNLKTKNVAQNSTFIKAHEIDAKSNFFGNVPTNDAKFQTNQNLNFSKISNIMTNYYPITTSQLNIDTNVNATVPNLNYYMNTSIHKNNNNPIPTNIIASKMVSLCNIPSNYYTNATIPSTISDIQSFSYFYGTEGYYKTSKQPLTISSSTFDSQSNVNTSTTEYSYPSVNQNILNNISLPKNFMGHSKFSIANSDALICNNSSLNENIGQPYLRHYSPFFGNPKYEANSFFPSKYIQPVMNSHFLVNNVISSPKIQPSNYQALNKMPTSSFLPSTYSYVAPIASETYLSNSYETNGTNLNRPSSNLMMSSTPAYPISVNDNSYTYYYSSDSAHKIPLTYQATGSAVIKNDKNQLLHSIVGNNSTVVDYNSNEQQSTVKPKNALESGCTEKKLNATNTALTIINNRPQSNLDILSSLSYIPVSEDESNLVKTFNSSLSLDKDSNEKQILVENEISKVENETIKHEPLMETENLEKLCLEIEKLNKFLDCLEKKNLNGITALDLKWKEYIEQQDSVSHRSSISVARCYPMKNRFPDILPYDFNRVELPSTKDDYINASYLQKLTPHSPNLIVTQCPLPSTYQDFWSMIFQEQIEIIVCLQSDEEMHGLQYWPFKRGEIKQYGAVSVHLQTQNSNQLCTERILSINLKDSKASHVTLHLQLHGWSLSNLMESPVRIVSFLDLFFDYFKKQRNTQHAVVIQCLSGVDKSGIFCLLTAAASELQAGKGICDITQIAVLMASKRRGILQDSFHLKFCYQVFLIYAQSIYNNIAKIKEPRCDITPCNGIENKMQPSNIESAFQNIETPKILDCLNPNKFHLDNVNKNIKKKFPKEKFFNSKMNFRESRDPADPLDQLDPLWFSDK